jgi:hypothetical protein
MIPGNINTDLISGADDTGYAISRSLRFNSSDSAYLSRVPASAGNRKTWTWAGWIKRARVANAYNESYFFSCIYSPNNSDSNYFRLGFSGDKILCGGYSMDVRTAAVYRDFSAWYHVVVAVDTTQATASNRVKLYVNGVQVTDLSSASYPSQNADLAINSTNAHHIGYTPDPAYGHDGYLADCFLIDGQALDPTSFGEFSATTGVWVPKAYSGPAATGNSFWLPFSDNSAATATTLGKDNFNLGNNWLPVNLSANAGSNTTNYSTLGTISRSGYVVGSPANAYDGSPADGALAVGTPWGAIEGTQSQTGLSLSFSSQVKIYYNVNIGGGSISVNGSSKSANVPSGGNTLIGTLTWTISEISSPFSSLSFTSPNNGVGVYVYGVEIDGLMLIDYSARLREMDSLIDVPVNGSEVDTGAGGEVRGNYCTWNPLNKGSNLTISNGNLDVSGSTGQATVLTTIPVVAGMKSYMEFTVTTDGAGGWGVTTNPAAENSYGEIAGKWWAYDNGGNFVIINQTSTGNYSPRVNSGDVLQLAIDYSTGKVHLGINNTWINSTNGTDGNPATGANPTFTLSTTAPIFPIFASAALLAAANFGQRPFAYTAPSGFKALCTANLPAPLVTKASDVFDVKLWTGNGSSQTISGLGFSPDLVWIKARSQGTDWHALFNTIVGATTRLFSNSTAAEATNAQTLSAFTSDGFSLGNTSEVNGSSMTYAAWCWDAGSSTVTNTQGSITSQVRANASAGFSVVTYTGTNVAATIGHGLGVEPHLIICKSRSGSTGWLVYHKSLGNTNYLILNSTDASAAAAGAWNNTTPTSTVFTIGTGSFVNTNGATQVSYCFAPVAGYSSFGSYTGNGSADGPFVYTGFRPRWVIIKRTDTTNHWIIQDAARNTYNVVDLKLVANTSGIENDPTTVGDTGANTLDFLSNGFKCRHTATGTNASGGTYVYAAFAESPFAANNRAR